MSRAAPALEIRRINHAFGRRAILCDVSFSVPPGSFTVLVGPNGAGKTTLISLLTHLYHARTGEILIFGYSLRRDAEAALAKIGVVFQQPTLDLDLTVLENMRYHAALHGLARRDADAGSREALAHLGLLDRIGDKVRVLSGGMRRRAEIARALIHKPRLLILDEPTVGLDLATRRTILDHVREICVSRSAAALWATHLMDEIRADDHVILLHRGSVLHSGRADEIGRERSASGFANAFLALTGQEP